MITSNVSNINVTEQDTPVYPDQERCDNYAKIVLDKCRVHNNVWGWDVYGKGQSDYQCIYIKNGIVGWKWKNSGGPTYPTIVVGTSFCAWSSLWEMIPIKWKDVKSWTIDIEWNFITPPSGGWWNLAFDIYFIKSACNPPGGYPDSNKGYNLMIWPQGYYWKETIVSDGLHNFYVDNPTNQSWPRRIFMLKDSPATPYGAVPGKGPFSLHIDVKKLFDNGAGSVLNGEWMIDQIHFGNENSGPGGTPNIGETNITRCDININGNTFVL